MDCPIYRVSINVKNLTIFWIIFVITPLSPISLTVISELMFTFCLMLKFIQMNLISLTVQYYLLFVKKVFLTPIHLPAETNFCDPACFDPLHKGQRLLKLINDIPIQAWPKEYLVLG